MRLNTPETGLSRRLRAIDETEELSAVVFPEFLHSELLFTDVGYAAATGKPVVLALIGMSTDVLPERVSSQVHAILEVDEETFEEFGPAAVKQAMCALHDGLRDGLFEDEPRPTVHDLQGMIVRVNPQ